jgi:hypothetical protein
LCFWYASMIALLLKPPSGDMWEGIIAHRERTAEGLAAARARGRRGGRPSVLTVARVRWLS